MDGGQQPIAPLTAGAPYHTIEALDPDFYRIITLGISFSNRTRLVSTGSSGRF
jgi:hypothetical protein